MTDDPVRTDPDPAHEAEAPAAPQTPQPEKKSVAPPSVPKQEAAPAAPSWLLHRINSISLRYKIAGTLIVILSLAVASLGVVTFARQNAILHSEMKSRAATLAHQLANVGKEGLLTKQEMPVLLHHYGHSEAGRCGLCHGPGCRGEGLCPQRPFQKGHGSRRSPGRGGIESRGPAVPGDASSTTMRSWTSRCRSP